jgi:hypothetical protein
MPVMIWPVRFTAFLLAVAVARPALAWAPEGHQIVAAIAARELTQTARAQISSLLGGEAAAMMVLESSWADEIRQQRPETNSWHYVNIELGSGGYRPARDCPNRDCVVGQIERDTAILSDPSASKPARREALLFLIHFIADLHQPLHAADRHDKGGNDLKLRFKDKRLSLHQVWDQEVVAVMGDDYARVAGNIMARLTAGQKAELENGTPTDWANESMIIAARKIYAPLPPSGRITLAPDYPRREMDLTRLQLTRAGLRLAATLNRVFR